MAFPTTQSSTDNLDSSEDNPSLARVDLYDAVVNLNTIISGADAANGVSLLDSNGKIPSGKLPQSITYSGGNQIINPSTGIVNIQDILRLTSQPKSDILDITTSTLAVGDIAIASDGSSSGTVAICLFNGYTWLKIDNTSQLV